ncbi:hypothetical protein GQ42DRAFT_159788 [Ramicandelaber brevisporus]|nr:hypothetical protein GQ42DRAFT_159788 [Ramicandelaber brevisporus]
MHLFGSFTAALAALLLVVFVSITEARPIPIPRPQQQPAAPAAPTAPTAPAPAANSNEPFTIETFAQSLPKETQQEILKKSGGDMVKARYLVEEIRLSRASPELAAKYFGANGAVKAYSGHPELSPAGAAGKQAKRGAKPKKAKKTRKANRKKTKSAKKNVDPVAIFQSLPPAKKQELYQKAGGDPNKLGALIGELVQKRKAKSKSGASTDPVAMFQALSPAEQQALLQQAGGDPSKVGELLAKRLEAQKNAKKAAGGAKSAEDPEALFKSLTPQQQQALFARAGGDPETVGVLLAEMVQAKKNPAAAAAAFGSKAAAAAAAGNPVAPSANLRKFMGLGSAAAASASAPAPAAKPPSLRQLAKSNPLAAVKNIEAMTAKTLGAKELYNLEHGIGANKAMLNVVNHLPGIQQAMRSANPMKTLVNAGMKAHPDLVAVANHAVPVTDWNTFLAHPTIQNLAKEPHFAAKLNEPGFKAKMEKILSNPVTQQKVSAGLNDKKVVEALMMMPL